jgi:hypothetical protein
MTITRLIARAEHNAFTRPVMRSMSGQSKKWEPARHLFREELSDARHCLSIN